MLRTFYLLVTFTEFAQKHTRLLRFNPTRLGDSPLAKSEKQVLKIGNMLNDFVIINIYILWLLQPTYQVMFGVVRIADDAPFVVPLAAL